MRRLEPQGLITDPGQEGDELSGPHRDMLAFLNMLEGAIRDSSAIRTCYVLEQLSSYVQTCFADEERHMRLQSYADLANHVREHRWFTNQLYQVRRVYLDRNLTLDSVAALKDWVAQHVSQSERRYVSWCATDPRASDRVSVGFIPSSQDAAQPEALSA